MVFKTGIRNYDKIKFEQLRKQIDDTFNLLHDELSKAYYEYWRHGKSYPFKGFDVQATPEESKKLFDILHGLLFHLYHLKFHGENIKLAIYPEEEYDYIYDKQGNVVGRHSEKALAQVEKLKLKGIEIQV
jgi:hypothetical protein